MFGYKQINHGRIVTWDQIPELYKDNEYLKGGYRIEYYGCFGVMRTLFMWHNETINVWSHLLGAIAFGIIGLCTAIKYKNMYADGDMMMQEFRQAYVKDKSLSLDIFIGDKFIQFDSDFSTEQFMTV